MNREQLRALWEEHVSTADKEVLDEIWQILCKRFGDVVDYACGNPASGMEDLLTFTDLVIEGWRIAQGRSKPPGRVAQASVDIDLDKYERECAQVASLYLAKKATNLPEVRRFRQERLAGRLLSTDEAKEFLRREVLSELPDFDSPGYEDAYVSWVQDMSHEELADFVIPTNRRVVFSDPTDKIYPYSNRGAMIFSSDEMQDCGGLALYLAAIFPWAADQVVWFLLTGEPPEVVPLELSYHRRRQVFTLSFAPWISEKTIRKAYRKGQKVIQGGDNRRMKERTLAVMRFVTEHTDDEGNRPSWSQLTDIWNEQHPGAWRFKDRFGLRKTYLRGEKELAAPWRKHPASRNR